MLIVALGCAWFVGRLLRRYFGRPGNESDQMAKLLGRIGQWSIAALGLAWALNIVGLEMGGVSFFILAALIIVALAIRPIAESFAISVAIASRPAFGIGDEIGVEGVVGEVLEVTERSVVVRRRDGARVHIPNADMISERVTVFSTEAERRSIIDVRLAYDTDIETADQVIRAALSDVDGLNRIGSIRATSLDDCVELSIRFWHDVEHRRSHRNERRRGSSSASGAPRSGDPSSTVVGGRPCRARTPRGHHFGATQSRADTQ